MESGVSFNIQKFSVNDGPGIRTTVFLKGCPLRCLWCHNPESNRVQKEILFTPAKCVGCGRCVVNCPQGGHKIDETGHAYDRTDCTGCGACAKECYPGALELAGKDQTVEEVLKEVMKDEIFYKNSGGGMTVSGGEPLAQPAFTTALLKAAKEKGLHTAMETCGFASAEVIRRVAEYTDLFLYDYKETDPALHKEYTGVDNIKILENLQLLADLGANIILRCPIIPGYNDRPDHFRGIAETANKIGAKEIHVEPYHPLGKGKSEALGREYALGDLSFPPEEEVKGWMETIQNQTAILVRKA